MVDNQDSPINAALRQFEATEAKVAKLERLWAEIGKLTPGGLQFGSDPAYVRVFQDVLAALPKIDGWKPESIPMDLNSIGQSRLDAKECGEISAEIAVEDEIEAPGRELEVLPEPSSLCHSGLRDSRSCLYGGGESALRLVDSANLRTECAGAEPRDSSRYQGLGAGEQVTGRL